MAAPLNVTAALLAAQAGSLGIGFSGAGFLIPFFLGVLDVLQRQLGVIKPDMPMAGASAGCLVLMVAKEAIAPGDMLHEAHRLGAYCKQRRNCYSILQMEVIKSAHKLLKPDACEYINQLGGTHVAITYPSPMGFQPAEQKLISHFDSRDDLIEAAAASIFIPYYAGGTRHFYYYTGPRLTTSFRGLPVYDGGFAGPGQGFLPCPPNVTYCIRISSLPAGLGLSALTLDGVLRGAPSATIRAAEVLAETLHGAGPGSSAAEAPSEDAAGANVPSAAAEAGQLAQLALALSQVVTPGEGQADIWPGRRHQIPGGAANWVASMLSPANGHGMRKMFKLGRAEAFSWAQEAGFAPVSKAKGRGAKRLGR